MNKLRSYLKDHKLTLAQFAEITGLPVSTLSRAQTGSCVPSPETMRVIADKTDGQVTPNDFVLPQRAPKADDAATPSEAA